MCRWVTLPQNEGVIEKWTLRTGGSFTLVIVKAGLAM